MLAQDPLTGGLYEVPEFGEVPELGGYDGYGLGFPGIGNLFSKLIPQVGNILGGGLPGIIGGLVGGGGAPRLPGLPMPPMPPLPGLPNIGNMVQGLFGGGGPAPFRPPFPLGWVRPPLPYTGLGPKRLYMRCAVWPGPRGLVPTSALTPAALPAVPAVPVLPTVPLPPGAMGGRRRRRGRRRR